MEAPTKKVHRKIVQALREGAPVLRASGLGVDAPKCKRPDGTNNDWTLVGDKPHHHSWKNEGEDVSNDAFDLDPLPPNFNFLGGESQIDYHLTEDYIEVFLDLFGLLEIEN